MNKLVMKALNEFGINEVESISRVENKDMWNIDDKYFIKTYNDFNCLERVLLIYRELYQAAVPLAVYNKTSAGELYVKTGGLLHDGIWRINNKNTINFRYSDVIYPDGNVFKFFMQTYGGQNARLMYADTTKVTLPTPPAIPVASNLKAYIQVL